jgi:8-oxo-dGTP pyrophosphatase MutT (NUDIX family)
MTTQHHLPVPPSPSATLILIRQHKAATEVYLMRRSSASKFMPGAFVFPGGSVEVDDRDIAFWCNHVDIPMDRLLHCLDGEADRMLPFAVAAIRETWEEAALLMATPKKAIVDMTSDRHGPSSFAQQIQSNGLDLSISRLGRWSHWITPERMPQRFNTFFFLAAVDKDQDCRPDNHEADRGVWINPKRALAENERGSLPLSPPTLVTLHQMLPFPDLDTLVAESRSRSWPAPIMPRLCPLETGTLIIEPWDPDYASDTVCVDVQPLKEDYLPVGAPFSRLWRHQGLCRPVRHPDASGG